MVHYYFDNKASLLRSVLDHALNPMAEAIGKLAAGGEAPPGAFVALLHELFRKHPRIPQLMVREVMLPGGVMQDYFIENLAPRLGGALPGLIEREQQAGRVRADADPRIDSLLILAVSIFPFIVKSLSERALGVAFDEAGIARLTAHSRQLLQRGLQA
jgi:AcrR family transcriptional regulator